MSEDKKQEILSTLEPKIVNQNPELTNKKDDL